MFIVQVSPAGGIWLQQTTGLWQEPRNQKCQKSSAGTWSAGSCYQAWKEGRLLETTTLPWTAPLLSVTLHTHFITKLCYLYLQNVLEFCGSSFSPLPFLCGWKSVFPETPLSSHCSPAHNFLAAVQCWQLCHTGVTDCPGFSPLRCRPFQGGLGLRRLPAPHQPGSFFFTFCFVFHLEFPFTTLLLS